MRRLPGVDTPPRKSTDVQQRSDPQVCKKFESIKEKEDVNCGHQSWCLDEHNLEGKKFLQ